jgi:MFS family permease
MALPVLIIVIVAVAYSMPAFKVFAITCSGCLFGLAQPMINMLINENTAQKHRATFHSIYSVGTRLLLVVVLPVTGYLAQNHPIHGVWLWLLLLACLVFMVAIPAAIAHSSQADNPHLV